jgi:hypothetical protein
MSKAIISKVLISRVIISKVIMSKAIIFIAIVLNCLPDLPGQVAPDDDSGCVFSGHFVWAISHVPGVATDAALTLVLVLNLHQNNLSMRGEFVEQSSPT